MTDTTQRLAQALADTYAIEREIGAGGMATVYLAQDLKHDRKVAVKVLRPELAEGLGPDRFLREIQVVARLNHPHILTLIDSGEANGFLYYVMPFVDGESLREKLEREKELELDEALGLTRQIAAALDYAHRQGVVHRDVKPENVLLHEGEAIVADFGIARALSAAGAKPITSTGIAVGTPAYMSPEQASGDPEVDGRSDIYSAGCMLYEMLAGEPPYTGPTAQAVIAKRFTEPVPDLTARRAITDDLMATIRRALARSPADRFASAAEFAEALAGRGKPTESGPTRRQIAVLPFANMSADPENEYFSDGITEEIINALTKVSELQVAARTSAFAFKGQHVDVRTIGDRLNVGAVLEGSVRRAGDKVRVTAQLIDVSNGYHLWSDRFDREMKDIFAIQDEISQAIVDTLTEKLVGAEPVTATKRSTVDVTAYELYLKGRYHWNRRTNPAMRKAAEYFEQALERDPSYAPAHAGIADCYTLLGWEAFGAMPPKEAFPRAEAAALKATELDPTLAEAYNSLGWTRMVYNWDRDGAEEAFRKAITLNPRYGMAHAWYAIQLVWTGREDDALAEAGEGERLDPLSLIIHTLAGWVYYFARKYEDSIERYRKTLELDPNYVRAYLGLGWAYEQLGRLDDAIREFERGIDLSHGSPRYVGALGHAYGLAGRETDARRMLERLTELSREHYVSASYVAAVHLGLGEHDAALEWLERAFEHRSGAMVFLHAEPQMDALRSDERFQDLVARVGYAGS